jgi:hypothetical protein
LGVIVGRNSRLVAAKLETLEHACEVVRVPAVAEYQGDGERLRVLSRAKVTRRLAEQLLEVIIDVQFVEDGLDQPAVPSQRLRGGDCRTNCCRPNVATPPAGRGVDRAGAPATVRRFAPAR